MDYVSARYLAETSRDAGKTEAAALSHGLGGGPATCGFGLVMDATLGLVLCGNKRWRLFARIDIGAVHPPQQFAQSQSYSASLRLPRGRVGKRGLVSSRKCVTCFAAVRALDIYLSALYSSIEAEMYKYKSYTVVMAKRRMTSPGVASSWCKPLALIGYDYTSFRKKRRMSFLVKRNGELKLLLDYINVTDYEGQSTWPKWVIFVGSEDGGVLIISCIEEKAWLYADGYWHRVDLVAAK